MNCVICEIGLTQPEFATANLERDGAIVLVKDVPANVCQNFGERYFDSTIIDQLLALAERAFGQGAELEIVRLPIAV